MRILKEAIEELLAQPRIGRCDFHTHSFLSDGALLPIEQLRRAYVKGHVAYAITDHVSAANLDIIEKVTRDCLLAIKQWGMVAIPGVEITHVPVDAIDSIVEMAKKKNALLIVLHGETISEPVEPGTNLASAKNKEVDILAHPGLITKQVATLCKKHDIFLEITSNKTHGVTNGHIVKVGKSVGAEFIQNTDSHKPSDMLTYEEGEAILKGAGMSPEDIEKTLQQSVRKLLRKILEQID